MLTAEKFGPVIRIRMARALMGRPLLWVNAFWVDGLMIDTGCRHTLPELRMAIEHEGLRVEQLVNTHTHEDHLGGNAELHRWFGVTPRDHPLGLPRLAQPETRREMHLYRQIYWGVVRDGCPGEPLGETVETDHYRFRVIHTPGHAPDHVALFEEREGWLFSGDMMLSPKLVYIRAHEEPLVMLDSMRTVAALPVRQLFCSHAYKVYPNSEPFKAKIERWENLRERARALEARGLTPAAITKELLGPPAFMDYVTRGDYTKVNLIAGLLGRGGEAKHVPA